MILILGGTTEGRASVRIADEGSAPYYYSTKGALQEIECAHGIAGGYRCGRGVMFKKFFLHLVRYACTEVDAHRALAGGQFVQLFFFGHRRTAFTTGENDGLYLFRDGEL